MIASVPTSADYWMLAAILLLLMLLIFFGVAEMALSRISKPKAAALADQGVKSARSLAKLVIDPARWVNPLLLSVNICQTVQATLTGVVAGRLFGAGGVVVGVLLNVVVFYVFAEAVPKTYAVLYPERAALIIARPTSFIVSFWPLQFVSRGLISLTNVIVRGKGLQSGPFVSEQEFLGIVEAAAQDEVIEHEERELIESVIEFGDTVVREVMVPRPDMVTVDHNMTITEALDVAISEGYSRLPVIQEGEEDIDVVGIAYTKDLMRAEREGAGASVMTALIRKVVIVPETKPVNRLMREMQREKYHLAVVADEHGSIVGIMVKSSTNSTMMRLEFSDFPMATIAWMAKCQLMMSTNCWRHIFPIPIGTHWPVSYSTWSNMCLSQVRVLKLRVGNSLWKSWWAAEFVPFRFPPTCKIFQNPDAKLVLQATLV